MKDSLKKAENFLLDAGSIHTGVWSALQDLTEYPHYPFLDSDKRKIIEQIRKGAELVRAGVNVFGVNGDTHVLRCPTCQSFPVGFRAIFAGKPEEVCLFRCPGCKKEGEEASDMITAAQAWNRDVLGSAGDVLDLQEFYEVCQTYRYAKDWRELNSVTAVEAYNALKAFIRNHFIPKK